MVSTRRPVLAVLAGVWLAVLSVLLFQCDATAMGKKSELFAAGVRTGGNIVGKYESLQLAVWYPSTRAWRESYQTTIAGWTVRADKNARPARGLFPVIIISHDAGKGRFASHDLASALAENGFVVIAPSHNGDSAQNAMALFSAASLYHRPIQLAAAYSTILNDPTIGPMMDTGRVGLLGVGSGALTVMQSLGVDIDESAAGRLCGDGQGGALCSPWVRERLRAMPADVRSIRASRGVNAFIGSMPWVKAAAFQTPGWLQLLRKNAAPKTEVQAAVVFAEHDEQYPLSAVAGQELSLFPDGFFRTLDFYSVKGADHNALEGEVPGDVLEMLPELGGTVPPAKAAVMRERRTGFLVSFFRSVLGAPTLPPVEGGDPDAPETEAMEADAPGALPNEAKKPGSIDAAEPSQAGSGEPAAESGSNPG